MSLVLNQYKDNVDRCWYDSSNVVFSECMDYEDALKDLKVVFKGGRTYLYKEVDVRDYVLFKMDSSQGKALNKYIIKHYETVRLTDTNMEELEKLKEKIIAENAGKENSIQDKPEDGISMHRIEYDEETTYVKLYLGDVLLIEGKNNTFSLFDIMNALGIKCSIDLENNNKEEKDGNPS